MLGIFRVKRLAHVDLWLSISRAATLSQRVCSVGSICRLRTFNAISGPSYVQAYCRCNVGNSAAHPPAASALSPSLFSLLQLSRHWGFIFFAGFFIILSPGFLLHGAFSLTALLHHCWLSLSRILRRHFLRCRQLRGCWIQLWLCSQRLLSLQSGGLASPRHATRWNGWDGNPRRQRAPSRWADQGISKALVQSQS